MSAFDLSAVGFVVLDTLCAHADAMPPRGGETIVDQMTMTVAGTAGATALDCAIVGLNVQVATELGKARCCFGWVDLFLRDRVRPVYAGRRAGVFVPTPPTLCEPQSVSRSADRDPPVYL